MRTPVAVSFAIAAACHAVLLFGFRFETPARALSMGDASAAVELDLAAEPEGEPAAPSAAPALAETTPELPPEPASEPEAAAPTSMPAASPSPEPAVAAAAPVPQPKRQNSGKKQQSAPTLHAAAPGRTTGNADSAGGTAGGGMQGVRVRSNPRPEYPARAKREHQEGVSLVSVEISPEGYPVNVTIERSSGFPLLDDAAVRGVRRWRFEPPSAPGRTVVTQPIHLNLVP